MIFFTNINFFYATNFTFAIRFMKKPIYLLFFTIFISFTQCNNDTNYIDINTINWELTKATRVDQIIYNSKSGKELHQKLLNYPELYENFYSRMLKIGHKNELFDTSKINLVTNNLNKFTEDSIMQIVFKSIDSTFRDISYYENEISKGFARYNALFEKNLKINIGTFYSNFNATVLESDQTIWIGLDMYLGKNNPIIKLLPPTTLPQYYRDKMEKKYIVSDVFFGYLMTSVYRPLGDEFLARMLAYGKVAYLIDLIIPDEEEENKFRYSKNELEWCKKNETYIWQHIIDKKLLYEKDPAKINVFFSDGPYTKNFGKESPSGIGIWLGYQMILDHAKKTNKSALEIITENNIQTLLNTYEPY